MAKTTLTMTVVFWLLVGMASAQAAGDAAAAGKAKSTVCVACHGVDGNGTADHNRPKLAGQHPEYLLKQLKDFKSGARKGEFMPAFVAGLSLEDMQDLAAYYASQTLKIDPLGNMEMAQEGQQLYRGGNAKMLVSACMSCHGPSGRGIPPRFPRVSGQHATYTENALKEFKAGKRTNDDEVMTRIAFRMSEAEIKAVAQYMSGLK